MQCYNVENTAAKALKMLSERLKLRREQMRFTQEELAALVVTDQKTIWRWEAGKGVPSLDKLQLLADALQVSIDWLVGRTDDLGAVESDLKPDEQAVIQAYREKPAMIQEAIVRALKAM